MPSIDLIDTRGTSTRRGSIEAIAREFAARFPEHRSGKRKVGREAEFPLVDPAGRPGDCSELWPRLLQEPKRNPIVDRRASDGAEFVVGVTAPEWSCIAEFGRATVEIAVGPDTSLLSLARVFDEALSEVGTAAQAAGYRLLGFGIHPRTLPRRSLVTPKRRYFSLVDILGTRCLRYGLTAADQLHVDVTRSELIGLMNVMNAMSGPLIALTANSSVYGGRVSGFCSGRERLMASITAEPYRHGEVPRAFADYEDYVEFLTSFQWLAMPDGLGGFRPYGGPFRAYMEANGPDFGAFERHEHYVWPSARPRTRLGTLEIRPACQQPPGSSWVPSALAAGWAEGWMGVHDYLADSLDRDRWAVMLRYRRAAVRDGVQAAEPIPGFLAHLIELAAEGLRRRGLGEEDLLGPARQSLERRIGPAQEAVRIFRSGGYPALVSSLAVA
jgi:gamma-glutamylcysteine synthetase